MISALFRIQKIYTFQKNLVQDDIDLNSPPLLDELILQLHVEQFPLKKSWSLAEWQLHIRQMRRKPHWSGLERPGNNFTINPTSITVSLNWKRTQNPEVLYEEWRILTPHWTSQLLRETLEKWASKNLTLKNNRAGVSRPTRLERSEKWLLKGSQSSKLQAPRPRPEATLSLALS